MKSRWILACTLCLAVAGASTVLADDGAGATKKSPSPAQPTPAQSNPSQSGKSSSGMMSHSGMSNSNMMSHSGMSNSNMASHSGMSNSNMASHSGMSSSTMTSKPHAETMAHASMHLTKNDVKSIQTALHQAGEDPGTVDGVLGRKTSAALRAYQKDHDLKVTGMADDETCARLGVKVGTHASS